MFSARIATRLPLSVMFASVCLRCGERLPVCELLRATRRLQYEGEALGIAVHDEWQRPFERRSQQRLARGGQGQHRAAVDLDEHIAHLEPRRLRGASPHDGADGGRALRQSRGAPFGLRVWIAHEKTELRGDAV